MAKRIGTQIIVASANMMKKIVITCGGSGGHIFPGLTVANALQAQGHEVAVIMSGRNVEEKSLDSWHGKTIKIRTKIPQFKSPVSAITSLVSLVSAVASSVKELKQFSPDALLAMGSYTSVAPVLAARILKIPVVLHEANAIPGKAVVFLSRFASKVCIAFQETAKHIKHSKTCLTGMPIRTTLFERDYPKPSHRDTFTVLVMGGSQGASAINRLMVETSKVLSQSDTVPQKIHIIHLTGTKDEDDIRNQYASIPISAEIFGFSNDMGLLYPSAAFCISRAGASSFFELCHFGLPTLFIPLPGLANDHQTANAECINKQTSCDFIKQSEATPEILASYLLSIKNDAQKLTLLKTLLLQNADSSATEKLAHAILDVT